MKTLTEFINEKLKLDDIPKLQKGGKWVDAKELKIDDICEGNIIVSRENNKYICITVDLAEKIFFKIFSNYKFKYVFVRKDRLSPVRYVYLEFKNTFPKHDTYSALDIMKVNTHKRSYKDVADLENDFKIIDKF